MTDRLHVPVLTFTPIGLYARGIIEELLSRGYADLLAREAAYWAREREGWRAYDRQAFDAPDTVGACLFFSRLGDAVVGFASYDPRPGPAYAVIGHNCILPEYRGRGYGSRQIREVLRRFADRGIRKAVVSTGEHPFFAPARRMYEACGFHEVRRVPGGPDPRYRLVEYEVDVG